MTLVSACRMLLETISLLLVQTEFFEQIMSNENKEQY